MQSKLVGGGGGKLDPYLTLYTRINLKQINDFHGEKQNHKKLISNMKNSFIILMQKKSFLVYYKQVIKKTWMFFKEKHC